MFSLINIYTDWSSWLPRGLTGTTVPRLGLCGRNGGNFCGRRWTRGGGQMETNENSSDS